MSVDRIRASVDQRALRDFCARWRVAELSVFGSALREDFGDDSDVDLLVTFFPDAEWSLLELVRMQDECRELFGREVDLVNRRAIERSPNWIRRNAILGSAEPIHVEG